MNFPLNFTDRRNLPDEHHPGVSVEHEDLSSANPSSIQKLSFKDVPVGTLMVPATTQSRKNILRINKNRYQSRQDKASKVDIRQSSFSEDRSNSHFFKQLSSDQKLLLRDEFGSKTSPHGNRHGDIRQL
mmetsp:Transcript_36890/g.56473  ORF Transcript_36890/g.56473 Transcript_36890/m.56473 type:complete len:129 (+) Transcript_36890:4427-4813(+)